MPGSNSRPNVSEGYEVPTELPGSTGWRAKNQARGHQSKNNTCQKGSREYMRIRTGKKFEISYFIILSKTSDSLVYPWTSYRNNQYNYDDVLLLVRTVNEKSIRYVYSSTVDSLYFLYCTSVVFGKSKLENQKSKVRPDLMRDRKRRSKTKNGVFRSGFFDQKKKAILS